MKEIVVAKWSRGGSSPANVLIGSEAFFHTFQGGWLWYAGFIANLSDLKRRYRVPGEMSLPDLLVFLYTKYGTEIIKHIAGPLAWVLWDDTQKKLIAIRDHVGIQDLFYTMDNNTVYVSNRISALLKTTSRPRQLNLRSVVAQIVVVPLLSGETFYQDIQAIPPGSLLTATANSIKTERYWQVEAGPQLKLSSDHEYAEAYHELLCHVVFGYTPPGKCGITLSSGLDSTSIAAAVRMNNPQANLTAFRWITPELPQANEDPYSAEVCAYLQLPSVVIRADMLWPLSSPAGVQTSVESPLYNYYTELWSFVFEEVYAHHITTLFTGLGGDPLFGADVFSYPDLLLTGRWGELVRQIREHRPHSRLYSTSLQILRSMGVRPIVETYLPYVLRPQPLPQPVGWLGAQLCNVYYEHFVERPKPSFRLLPGRQQRLNTLRNPNASWAIKDVMRRASVQGVELRHPLSDYRLIEFAVNLPTTQTFRAARRKIIVRNAMRGYLPDSILDRREKIYLGTLFHRGLRERETSKVWALLTNMRAAELGFVDESKVQQAYRDYLDGKSSSVFWHTLTLEDWLRRYFS